MKYRVTGGADGTAGIDVGARRYEPGDIVEMTQPKAAWLVERGLLVADGKQVAADEPAVDEDDAFEALDTDDEGDED